ncbi:MAG TPA: tyrosine-type recombinase/integrase [Saprospiraceae bacterium]|nr:tyrosine-type recombinase/integrase [Saprospiraceae bacterium]
MHQTFVTFSKAELDKLKPSHKSYEVSDRKISGLRLWISPNNTRTFIFLKKFQGRTLRIKIGRYHEFSIDEVRQRAIKLSAQIADGIDPTAQKKAIKLEPTFKELFDYYYKMHSQRFNKSPEHNKRIMNFHILPVIGNKKADKITREQIRNLHFNIGENRGKITANRVITIVQSTYNFCIKEGYWKGDNPCLGLRKFQEHSRDRFLNLEEIKSFFNALSQEEQIFQDFFSLSIFTGARKSNLLSIKYTDIDFNLKRWRISETQTKNGDVNIIMLSAPAIEILERRKINNEQLNMPSLFVFPGEGEGGYLKDPKRSFDRIRERMGIDDIRIHDLRRTLGSYMAIQGASLPIIGKALNHKNLNSTAIYARLSLDPVHDAVDLASKFIASVAAK